MGTQETNTPTSTTIKVRDRNMYTYPKPPTRITSTFRDAVLKMSGGKDL